MINLIKKLGGTFVYGTVAAFGTMAGMSLFGKVTNPVERAKLKKKFKVIKNELSKDEKEEEA